MGSPRPRRGRRDRGAWLATVGLVALTAFPSLAAAQTPNYQRVLAVAGQPAGEAVEGLLRILEEIDGRADDDARYARYLAELALAAREEPSDEALRAAREALEQLGSREAEAAAYYTSELAKVHVVGGRYVEADRVAEFGLAYVDREQAWSQVPRLWQVRSEVARLLGQWSRAATCLDEMERAIRADDAPELRSAAGLIEQNHMYRARLELARAQNLLELGLLDQCRDELARGEEAARLSKDPNALLEMRFLAIDRALMGEDFGEAVELARKALAEVGGDPARQAPRTVALLRLAEGLAQAELARQAVVSGVKDPPEASDAVRCFESALAAKILIPGERLKAVLALADLEVTLGKHSEAGEHLQSAAALVETMAADAGASTREEVLVAVHRWRLALASGQRGAQLEPSAADLRKAFARFLEQWRSTPKRPGGIGFLHLGWRQLVVSEALRVELELADEERAFERLLEVQSLGTAARERGWKTPSVSEIRAALLAPGRGLLVLLPARDRSHLFVLDSETLRHFELTSGDRLRKLARLVTSALVDPRGAVDATELRALSKELFPAGVQERLAGWKGVVVLGFDLVRNLPFGLLLDENGKRIAEKLAVSVVPSLPVALELSRRPRAEAPAKLDLALIAAPDADPTLVLPSFPFGRDERERLTGPFEHVLVLTGDDAVKSALLGRRDWTEARIVHFFTHGFEEREEHAAALVLAPAGGKDCLLRARDVASLELDGIVILSACSAGRGPLRLGDDRFVHLGGAFLDAGARCVVLSRYPVNARATLELMARLHRHLAAGEAPAEALRAALAESAGTDAFRSAAFEVLGWGFEPVVTR